MTSKHWQIRFNLCTSAPFQATQRVSVDGPTFFDGGEATIQAAQMAATTEHANDILIRAYRGVDDDGAGQHWIEWEITK